MIPARYWVSRSDKRVECTLCPRACVLRKDQRGICGIRVNRLGKMYTQADEGPSAVCLDPVEKKPLYHFLPGTAILSLGGFGCNLHCVFCQNAELSHPSTPPPSRAPLSPEAIVELASREDCPSVAFTYNEPVIALEVLCDVALACRAAGRRVVAVTAGSINAEPRREFLSSLDAVNVDLKAFSDRFYRRYCSARIEPVKDTLRDIRLHSSVWLEITTLLIPGLNDSEREIRELSAWIGAELGQDVPLHFSAFHPAGALSDLPSTSPGTVIAARRYAREEGLRYVYTGNIHDEEGSTTWCPSCGTALIRRQGYRTRILALDGQGSCATCGQRCPGIWM